VYSAKIDGEPTTFGTSGLLYRSNKLMYDRKTNTLWSSLTGTPVIGKLAARDDLQLSYFPVSLTTWREWVAEYPDTGIISNDTGYYRPSWYSPESDDGSFYYSYRADPETMFPVWNRDDRLAPKDIVLGLSDGGASKAYPVQTLMDARVVNDTVGGLDVVILASGATPDVRVFERGDMRFSPDPGIVALAVPSTVVDAGGQTWEVTDAGLVGPNGEELPRLPSYVAFWFGWYAFYPDTLLYDGGGD